MDSINTERSYTEYEVTEPTTDFAIGFDNYSGEDKDAIHVTLDGVNLDNLDYTVVRQNAQVIQVTPAIESGVVRIQRETYIDQAFHKFTAGALFSPKAMDENFEQIRHSQQEVNDGFLVVANNSSNIIHAAEVALDSALNTEQRVVLAEGRISTALDEVEDAVTTVSTAATQIDEAITTVKHTAAQAVNTAIEGVAIDANLITDALTVTIPPAGSSGDPRNQAAKNAENISVMDFFTASERSSYAELGVSFDAKRPIQEFFDYICANDVGTAYCSGAFGVSDGLLLGGVNGGKTKNIVGNFSLELSNPSTDVIIDYLLKVQVPSLFWSGEIGLFGVGGVFYDRRRINRAIVIGGEYYATHSHFTSINVDGGFRYFGVLLDNVTTGARVDKIRIKRVGSGLPQDGYSLLANYSNRVDVISAGSAQSSTFTVDVLPPDDLDSPALAVIAGRVHLIKSIDREASTITTQTLVDIGVATGELRYVFGAGVMTRGGDASVLRIGKINCSYGSIAYWSGALYPAIVDNITAQHNFIGLMIGTSTTAAHVGGQINGLYCEWHDYYIFRLTKYPLTMLIGTTYAFDISKVGYGYNFRNTDSNIRTDGNLDGIAMQIDGQLLTSEYDNAPAGVVDVTSLKRSKVIKVGATATFNISAPNLNMLKAYGFSSRQVVQYRSAASSSAPTSTVFNAPTGYTVNEQAQVTFTGFVGNHAIYDVILDETRKNFLVVRLATY